MALASHQHWWGIVGRPDSAGAQTIVWLEPNGLAWDHGLQVGEVVVAADGVAPAADSFGLNTARQLEVVGAYGSRQVVFDWTRPTGFSGSSSRGFLVVSLFFVLAGALVYLKAKSREQAQAFVVLCACFAFALVVVPVGALGHPWAVRLTFLSSVLAPSSFAHFFLTFPVNRIAGSLRVRILLRAYLTLVVGACLAYDAFLAGVSIPAGFVTIERLGLLSIALGLGTGLVSLLLGFFRDCSSRVRQQLRIAAGGAVPGILGFVGLSLLPKVLWPDAFPVDPSVTFLGTAFIPLAIGYAILRHQLIQADVIIRRSVFYGAVTVAITVCYLLLVAVSYPIYTLLTGRSGVLPLVVSAIAAALVAEPLRRATQVWVERVFFSDVYTYRQILEAPSVSLTRIASTDELVASLVRMLQAALPVDYLALFVRDQSQGTDTYRLRWSDGGPREDEVSAEDLLAAVGEAAPITRATLLPRPVDAGSPLSGARVVVPHLSGGQTIAYLALGARRDGDSYSGADLEFLTSAAERYAVALENALLHESVRRQAETDSLTGLYNHRYVLEHLETAVAEARQSRQPLAVLMADINSFKFYNDTFGHTTGDHVLWNVAQVLRQACRKEDLVGRYGGDEFVVVLRNTDHDAAWNVADRLTRAIQRQSIQVDGGTPIVLSAAIGVAVMPEDGDDPLTLIAAADVAMYGDKRIHSVAEGSLPDIADVPSPALLGLLWAIQQKDGYVAGHSERTALWAVRLAEALGLPESEVKRIRIAALLHDIGKLGVPEAILNKPGPLTPDERAVIERHVELGVHLLKLVGDIPDLGEIIETVAHHHERWDGRGYPAGLSGQAISVSGRIMGVADAYSAMTTDRPYRPRLSRREALERIQRGAGSQFDPWVVEAMPAVLAVECGDPSATPAVAAPPVAASPYGVAVSPRPVR